MDVLLAVLSIIFVFTLIVKLITISAELKSIKEFHIHNLDFDLRVLVNQLEYKVDRVHRSLSDKIEAIDHPNTLKRIEKLETQIEMLSRSNVISNYLNK